MGKADCLRSRWVAGGCLRCGKPMDVAHLDLLATTAPTCTACCRHCSPQPQGAIAEAVVRVTHPDDDRRAS